MWIAFRKLSKRHRQSSEKAHASNASRASRSHSPSHFMKAAKRRNTMNSRDAAYEAQLQELLISTAAEAGAAQDDTDKVDKASVAKSDDGAEESIEIGLGGRKKRKRADDEVYEASFASTMRSIADH